jgi:hypothetical protein
MRWNSASSVSSHIALVALLENRRRSRVIERGHYAGDVYAPAFIPGGIRAGSSRQFTFLRRSRFIPVALSALHLSTTLVRAVKKISAQAE